MKFAASLGAGLAAALLIVVSGVTCGQDKIADEKSLLERATKSQTTAGYNADDWKLAALKPGDVVYGGVPGQSDFYTTKATVDASELDVAKLWKSLQVKPHPKFGYRPQVQQYTVQKAVTVPLGKAVANPKLGPGGGDQYFISDFKNVLKAAGPVIDLKK